MDEDKSHTIDKLEKARTSAKRCLTQSSDLLRDGLHALRDDRPHVADEFMERVIDMLDKEIAHLNGWEG